MCLSILKREINREEALFQLCFLKPFFSKPEDALMITKGADGQVSMVLGQAKGKNKPKKICFCYPDSKKNHMAKKLLVK